MSKWYYSEFLPWVTENHEGFVLEEPISEGDYDGNKIYIRVPPSGLTEGPPKWYIIGLDEYIDRFGLQPSPFSDPRARYNFP